MQAWIQTQAYLAEHAQAAAFCNAGGLGELVIVRALLATSWPYLGNRCTVSRAKHQPYLGIRAFAKQPGQHRAIWKSGILFQPMKSRVACGCSACVLMQLEHSAAAHLGPPFLDSCQGHVLWWCANEDGAKLPTRDVLQGVVNLEGACLQPQYTSRPLDYWKRPYSKMFMACDNTCPMQS